MSQTAPKQLTISNGVLALSGYGLRVSVERGHLIANDGAGQERRNGRFARVGSGLKRVIVLGHSGSVSLEALRWLREIGAAFVQIGANGELIATGIPHEVSDVRLRRSQAIAGVSSMGLEIARSLLDDKLAGQQRVVDDFGNQRAVRAALAEAREGLGAAKTLDELRFAESRGAAAYWSAWETIAVRFAGRDAKHVPAHWRAFGTRRSLLTPGPRKATNPPNALVNYLYTIVMVEAQFAALAVGCDPALGVIHTDKPSRDSLACDLMEPVRPSVDSYLLNLLETHTFSRSDFFETRDGNCRLMPEIAEPLAATASRWRRLIGPIAERVGAAFSGADVSSIRVSTQQPASAAFQSTKFRSPLTGRNRSRPMTPKAASVAAVHLPRRCRECGAAVRGSRIYCDACLPIAARRASQKGMETLLQQRALNIDGRSSESTRTKHAESNVRYRKAQIAWESAQSVIPAPKVFDEEILPLFKDVPDLVLAKATGLTTTSINTARKGKKRPHPMHWELLRNAAIEYRAAYQPLPDHMRDPTFFSREIKPRLRLIGPGGIVDATSLSIQYARRMVYGHDVPHIRHWPAILRAIEKKQSSR